MPAVQVTSFQGGLPQPGRGYSSRHGWRQASQLDEAILKLLGPQRYARYCAALEGLDDGDGQRPDLTVSDLDGVRQVQRGLQDDHHGPVVRAVTDLGKFFKHVL